MPSPSREEEEAARRAREAAIAERERSVMEESMRRRFAEQTAAGAMARDEFVNQDVHFAYDSFLLDDEAKTLLEKKAAWLKGNPSTAVKIEGHCDERGTTAYNLALGERRANSAKQYLTALGIPAARLSTISYGEESPLDPSHSESAWSRNRRAHFAITGQ
jgi:peptidoglycan-associated lipoprotein